MYCKGLSGYNRVSKDVNEINSLATYTSTKYSQQMLHAMNGRGKRTPFVFKAMFSSSSRFSKRINHDKQIITKHLKH